MTIVMLSSILVLSSCLKSPPPLGLGALSSQVFSFEQFSTTCTLYNFTDVNNVTGLCGAQYPSYSYYDENTSIWYLLCCSFDNNKCQAGNYSNVYGMCNALSGSNITFSTYYQSGRWRAVCCDVSGGNCYIDTDVIPSDNSTICDMKIGQNIFSSSYNSSSTDWVGVCCITGG